jgi:sarcosine oxidase
VNEEIEFAVIGGGLLGLATARALGQRGHEVLLLERDSVGNERAGSKGSARIFRFGYDERFYVDMARTALPMWRELEEETGRDLLSITGQLSFGESLDLLREAMTASGARFEELDQSEAASRVPALNVESPAIFEPASGVLAADRCLAALRQSSESSGVEIREGSRVTALGEEGRRVHIKTDAGDTVTTSVAVVCAGHWTSELLRAAGIDLYLIPTLEQVGFLSPVTGRDTEVPVFIERGEPGRPWIYGLPAGSPGLLKVALHGAGPVSDPDDTPLDPDPRLIAELVERCVRLLPAHHPEPVSTERCFYDSSTDGDFVIDRSGRVVIGAGTSGHGFKFGPLLGELLADLATGAPPRVEMERFSARRRAVAHKVPGPHGITRR